MLLNFVSTVYFNAEDPTEELVTMNGFHEHTNSTHRNEMLAVDRNTNVQR